MTLRRPRFVKVAGAAAAIVVVAAIGLLPSSAIQNGTLSHPGGDDVARGAFHIHSKRSDGSGTVDAIAAAAARAGLQFIILTDHGDGTRPPDPPAYLHGVLTIDAVELSTTSGHYLALGLPAAPYPLAGTPEDVIEDVHRLGGFGVAAHPGSPRPSLRWQAWASDFDGLEWINADSEWRDEAWTTLLRSLLTLPIRPPETIAALLDRPDAVLARWDEATRTRRVIALAGADAHARLGLRSDADPDQSAIHVPLPSYESTFRTFSNHVVLEGPLTGNAAIDAPHLLDAIRQGRVYTVIDGQGTPGGLDFVGWSGTRVVRMGGELPAGDSSVRARVSGPPGGRLVLFRDGTAMPVTARDLDIGVRVEPGTYRLEFYMPATPGTPPVPWIVSNPIYVGLETPTAAADQLPRSRIPARASDAAAEAGRGDLSTVVARDPQSRALAGDPPVLWTFALSPGAAHGQFAAMRIPITAGLAAFDRVRFTAASERPIRVRCQLRAGSGTERWGRTFYADTEPRTIDLRLQDFQPIGVPSSPAPPLDKVDSLLFVVDTLNSLPGATGTITISNVGFVR